MELLKGKHLVPKSSEDFFKLCRKLGNFTGVMRLLGDIHGNFYRADMLIDNGYVVSASFENITTREILFKEAALKMIQKKLAGSVGNLEIYEFNKAELNSTKKENKEAALSSPVDIRNLDMQVKSIGKKNVVEGRSLGIIDRLYSGVPVSRLPRREKEVMEKRLRDPRIKRELESRGVKANMEGLARMVKGMEGIDIQALKKKIEVKEELKRRRQETDKQIADRFSKIGRGDENKEYKAQKGTVKTSIDKLFELVKKYNRLKISDSLARRLNVSRTQIEEWCIILEDHDLIELHYPTIGEPEARLVQKT